MGAEPVVACDLPLVRPVGVACRDGERSGVGRVHDRAVAQCGDRQRAAGGRQVRTKPCAVHPSDGRCGIRVFAIGRVVARGEGRDRQHRRVQIVGQPRHERLGVAEVAVGRVVGGVGDHLADGGRADARVQDRARVVHAGDQHVGAVARRCGWVHQPARRRHHVVGAPLVRVGAGDLQAAEVLDRHRHEGHAGLLAEVGGGGVELRRRIVQDDAGVVRRDRYRREHEEVGAGLHLVAQHDALDVAQRAVHAGERSDLLRLREDAQVVGYTVQVAHAFGVLQLRCRRAQVAGRVGQDAGVAGIRVVRVGIVQRGLVGQDEDAAQPAELRDRRRDEGVADQDVLVFFLDHFITRGRHGLDHVVAPGQADEGLACSNLRWRERMRRDVGCAREGVAAVVRRGLHLVPVVPAVVAAGAVDNGAGAVERQGVLVERVGAQLSGAAHVDLLAGGLAHHAGAGRRIAQAAVGADEILKASRRGAEVGTGRVVDQIDVVVEARCLRAVDQRQRLGAIGVLDLLIELDRDARHQRRPDVLHVVALLIERTRHRQHHGALDAAVLASSVGRAQPVDGVALADEALQAVRDGTRHLGADARLSRCIGRTPETGAGPGSGHDDLTRGRIDRSPIHLSATVDVHLHAGLLEAGGVGLDHVPVEQREHLGQHTVAAAVGQGLHVDGAVAVARGHPQIGDAWKRRWVGQARSERVEQHVLVVLREPRQHRDVAQRDVGSDHRHSLPLDDLVQPLVPDHHFIHARRRAGQGERAIRLALRDGDRRAIAGLRIERHLAGGGFQQVVRARVPQPDVGRMRHVLAGDLAADRVSRGSRHKRLQEISAGRRHVVRIDEADRGVESRRAELLEVDRLLDAEEGILGRGAFQRLGLPPDFAHALARRRRVSDDVVAGRGQVLDQRVAGKGVCGCQRVAVGGHPAIGVQRQVSCERGCRLVVGDVRAGVDHADHIGLGGDGIRRGLRTHCVVRVAGQPGALGGRRRRCIGGYRGGIRIIGAAWHAEQGVAQRHVERVVGLLAGGVADAAGRVEQDHVEAAETVADLAAVDLPVGRAVVFVDEHTQLRRHQRRGLQLQADRGLSRLDLAAAHHVAGSNRGGDGCITR